MTAARPRGPAAVGRGRAAGRDEPAAVRPRRPARRSPADRPARRLRRLTSTGGTTRNASTGDGSDGPRRSPGGLAFGESRPPSASRHRSAPGITDRRDDARGRVTCCSAGRATHSRSTGRSCPARTSSTGVRRVHGGLTLIHGGGGDDAITVTGGGGPIRRSSSTATRPRTAAGTRATRGRALVARLRLEAVRQRDRQRADVPPAAREPFADRGQRHDRRVASGDAGLDDRRRRVRRRRATTRSPAATRRRLPRRRLGRRHDRGRRRQRPDLRRLRASTSTSARGRSRSRRSNGPRGAERRRTRCGRRHAATATGGDGRRSSVTTARSTRTSRRPSSGPNGYVRPAASRRRSRRRLAIQSLATVAAAERRRRHDHGGSAGNDIVSAARRPTSISGGAGNDLVFGDHGQVDEADSIDLTRCCR